MTETLAPLELAEAVRAGSRSALARAITLVESRRADHRTAARELVTALDPPGGDAGSQAWRVGISGVPGVGKSTFIETLGMTLVERGHRVGVLAVDPSSVRTGGSVLGDKTRMSRLAASDHAYVRPSPTGGTLGGVARATSQAITIVEAAGFDVVLVETVGVGQSEIAVAQMVDSFLLLALARSGDQLQGIKKGVLEIADVIAVNKADGDHLADARVAVRELSSALRLVYSGASASGWVPRAVTCSGLTGDGVDAVWALIGEHRESLGTDGLARKRAAQQWALVEATVRDEVLERLRRSPSVAAAMDGARSRVLSGDLPAAAAADLILAALDGRPS